jgi:hypothetical protein
MMNGPAGYGRYDDDPEHVGCPFARSDKSPCAARVGRLALDPEDRCAGCSNTMEYLAEDLAGYYEPARTLLAAGSPVTLADEFAAMIQEITEPGRAGGGG